MSLAVVTDSAACLPPALLRAHGIGVVELHALPGADGAQPATTARPSVDELAGAYARALDGADEVLAVHLASVLSGTVDNARLAAERVGEAVTVLDSGASAGALGLAVLAACEARDARTGAALARESASRSHLFFLVEDLSHLRRGGRIDRATALVGSALGIRPVLGSSPDGIRVVETVRGAARSRRHLIAQAVHAAGGTALTGPRPPAAPVRLAVHYGDDPAQGRALENDLAEAMAEAGAVVDSILRSPVDEAIRVHLGPGALGIVVAPALAPSR
ncbi:MAG: DegV family protein [Actinomyces sp.]|uniref:DegV family protein n=1 Tax=Actinomyces sp. TaxID=29317 RepID=UPI0026DA7DB2|nr:DegV family protein [Actinomyces sp.]MDO4242617.1 DegV family protein [Actinomyces sp.]